MELQSLITAVLQGKESVLSLVPHLLSLFLMFSIYKVLEGKAAKVATYYAISSNALLGGKVNVLVSTWRLITPDIALIGRKEFSYTSSNGFESVTVRVIGMDLSFVHFINEEKKRGVIPVEVFVKQVQVYEEIKGF